MRRARATLRWVPDSLPSRVFPSGNEHDRPRVQGWGRFRSGSPQAQATSSSPADRSPPRSGGSVVVGSCARLRSSAPSPHDKQCSSEPRRVVEGQCRPGGVCRRSHTLGGCRHPPSRRRRGRAERSRRVRSSTRSGAGSPTSGSRSPTAATSAAPTACPRRACSGSPRDELLTYEEQARIARVCVERFGFESVRITGGEPTRAGAPHPAGRDARAARRRHRDDHERREARRARARPRRGRPPPDQRVARLAAARTCSCSSPSATTSTACSPASTPRSTPASTRSRSTAW